MGYYSLLSWDEGDEACHHGAQKLYSQLMVPGVLGQTLGYLRTTCFGNGHQLEGTDLSLPLRGLGEGGELNVACLRRQIISPTFLPK